MVCGCVGARRERHPKGTPDDIDRIHALVFESVRPALFLLSSCPMRTHPCLPASASARSPPHTPLLTCTPPLPPPQVCREIDAGPPGSPETFTVLLDLTSTNARFDIGSFQMLGKTLKLGFRGRLHRLYIFPVGRLERLAFAALKAVMGKGTPQKARRRGRVFMGEESVGVSERVFCHVGGSGLSSACAAC